MPGGTAVVRVTGSAGRFEEFRERIRWLLVRDPDVDPYTEQHSAERLEYRFALQKGIPFPTFVAASAEFPELRVEAQWDQDGATGGAAIEQGRLVEKWTGPRRKE
ncbi:MAG: hypothetical protein L0271_13110 [Gemmatimonadetes bacterium]|nr:hypothetical protein [Gemmatimonadota bacterium]